MDLLCKKLLFFTKNHGITPKTMQNYYNIVVYYSNVALITVLFW